MKTWMSGILLLCLSGCAQQEGGGYVTIGGVRVNPVTASVFEVIPRPGEEINGLWCGAGQYARFELGAPDNARVYVVSGAGPGVTSDSKSAAQFSLGPLAQAEGAGARNSTWGPQLGASTTVRNARSRCGIRQSSDD